MKQMSLKIEYIKYKLIFLYAESSFAMGYLQGSDCASDFYCQRNHGNLDSKTI